MSKAAKINKAINWGIWIAGAYFIGTAIAGAIKRRREGTNGIGKVERIKRRVYKEVSLAQGRGVDFSKKYDDLTKAEKDALKLVGNEVGWKQSKRAIDSGKSYVESYYNSLRRAWNAVSGIVGIGKAYDVKDANGNVCLTWIEDAAAHVKHEQEIEEIHKRTLEAEQRAAEARRRNAATRRAIQRGQAPVEPAKPAKRQTQEYLDRFSFAQQVWRDNYDSPFYKDADKVQENDHPEVKQWQYRHDYFADLYANKQLRKRGGNIERKSLTDKKWETVTTISTMWGEYLDKIKEAEKIAYNKAGWQRSEAELNEMRIALLDKAQHMELVFRDENNNWQVIKGGERYDYLDMINYVMMIRRSYHNNASDTTELTVYPIRAFETLEDAENFGWKPNAGRDREGVLTSTRTVKVIPIWDVDVKSITGVY